MSVFGRRWRGLLENRFRLEKGLRLVHRPIGSSNATVSNRLLHEGTIWRNALPARDFRKSGKLKLDKGQFEIVRDHVLATSTTPTAAESSWPTCRAALEV